MFRAGLGEGSLLGFALSVCHAVAETTLLGWYGVPLAGLDLILILLIYAALGLAGGAALWLILYLAAGGSRWSAALLDSLSRRRVIGLSALAVYAAVGCYLVASCSSGPIAGAGCAAVILAGLWAAWLLFRSGFRSWAASAGLLGLCLLVTSATAAAAEFDPFKPEERATLVLCSALPGLAAMLAATLGRRRSASRRPAAAESGPAFLALILVLDLGLWLTVWPTAFEPGVREQAGTTVRAKPGAPNVVLIVLDTVRASHLELFGYSRQTMPNLAAFARRECAVAIASIATSPLSLESHASMFTGMYASSHGAHLRFARDRQGAPYQLRGDVPTLAGWLRRRGYRTAGIAGNFGVLPRFALERGFDTFDARPARAHRAEQLSWLGAFRIGPHRASALIRFRLPAALGRSASWLGSAQPTYRRAAEVRRRAMEWLRRDDERPFFLFMNYFDAHAPYLPLGGGEALPPRPAGLRWRGFPGEHYPALREGTPAFRRQALDYIRGQYDAELGYVDRQFHALLEDLKRLGHYDDTLFVVVSDHGEAFLEHGWFDHGRTLYQPELSVPMLVKLPKDRALQPPPDVRHMQSVDIFPTVMNVLGMDIPPTVEGSPWAAGRSYAISEVFSSPARGADSETREDLFAVVLGDWKYLRSSRGWEASYDLIGDPAERKSILGSRPDLEAQARSIWRQRQSALLEKVRRKELDPRALEELRALGYAR
ncbi:MAG TPA: sulfatase [Acidobacteriota bacterium]